MTTTITQCQLNAFVDGELPAAEAAQVAAAIAADPELAQSAARLHRIKAALGSACADLPLPATPQPARRGSFAPARLAACFGLAAMVLLLVASVPGSAPNLPVRELPRLAHHDQWLAHAGAQTELALPAGAEWMEPVMSASGLQLVHYEQGPERTHFGFKGPNACRLSLFVSAPDRIVASLQMALSDEIQHAHWHSGGYAFEMIARDMATARFATVAAGLQQGSRAHEDDAGLRVALLQSARLPCAS